MACRGILPCDQPSGLDDDGCTLPCTACEAYAGPWDHIAGVPTELCNKPAQVDAHTAWSLRLVTYNVTALCNAADEECLDASFHRAGAHIVGLQETRRFPGVRTSTQHYHRLAAAGCNGNLGCQLWIHKSLAPAVCGGTPVTASLAKAVVVKAEPRLLVVVLAFGTTRLGIAVGHAPTSAATDEERETWWHELDSALLSLPRQAIPILLLDANARVTAHARTDTFTTARLDNHNAHCLASLLVERRLGTTPLYTTAGEGPITWTSPHGGSAQLDYVVLPDEELAACPTTRCAGRFC